MPRRNERIISGAAVRVLRERMGLTVRWLAGYLGVSRQAVSDWEAETTPMPAAAAERLRDLAHTFEGIVDALASEPTEVVTVPRRRSPGDRYPLAWYDAVAYEAADISGKSIEYES